MTQSEVTLLSERSGREGGMEWGEVQGVGFCTGGEWEMGGHARGIVAFNNFLVRLILQPAH